MILYNSVAFLLIALSKTYSLPTEPNLDIKDEYIISFQNPDRSQLSSDQITSKYSNRLKSHGHNVVIKDAGRNTFEHHEDALLVKADRLDIDSLRQSGAKVYANKVVNIFGEQRPAP